MRERAGEAETPRRLLLLLPLICVREGLAPERRSPEAGLSAQNPGGPGKHPLPGLGAFRGCGGVLEPQPGVGARRGGAGQHPGWTIWEFLIQDIGCFCDRRLGPQGFPSSFLSSPWHPFLPSPLRGRSALLALGALWSGAGWAARQLCLRLRYTPASAHNDGRVAVLSIHPSSHRRVDCGCARCWGRHSQRDQQGPRLQG